MRTIAAIVLFAAASVATASAQQAKQDPAPKIPFSMDHGRSTAAAAAAQATAAANAAKASAAASAAAASRPASFSINGENVIRAAPALTPEQQKVEEEGRAAWQSRCRPTVVEDRDGMRRTKYAEPDCDLSRFNTAGR